MQAYVWDRHYGICLAKNRHEDVVNSVAFNPADSEMLVTTSDDSTIKVCKITPVDAQHLLHPLITDMAINEQSPRAEEIAFLVNCYR